MFPRDVYTFHDEENGIWLGRSVPPLYNPNQSVGELIWRVLNRAPFKIAQISADSGIRLTYHEMRLRSTRVAQNLSSMGFQSGDLVSIVARNNEKLAPVVFGCFMLGLSINSLDPSFHKEDFAHMFKSIRPKTVFCEGDLIEEITAACEIADISPNLIIFGPRVNGYTRVDDLLVETGSEQHFQPAHIEDSANTLAIILCSSGTTGKSKGVCLSHSLCVANLSDIWPCYESDRVLCLSSLYWISGIGTLMTGTIAGATRIVTTEKFSAGMMINLIEQYRVNVIFFPPAHALAILNDPTVGMADFSSLRMVLCGGGAVSPDLKRSFEMYLSKGKFVVVYGLSELGGLGTLSDVCYKSGSVGVLSNGAEAKIVDDEGNVVGFEEQGELLIRKQFVFMEYYGNSESTAEMLDEDGWLHTGDIAYVDEDGIFFVVDRKKDIIKYAGYQISPTEIENVILQVPGVISACVTGIPVPGNDLPVALVIKSPESAVTENDIVDAVASNMIDFKHLRGGVHFVTAFPMTPSGKILRRKCRDIAIEFYNQSTSISIFNLVTMSTTYNPDSKVWTGITQPSLLNPHANLGQLILNMLERNPSKVAQVSVDTGVSVTCGEMRLRTIRAVQNLTALGFPRKGDFVCFATRNRENLAPLVYACFLIGAPVHCLDPDFTVSDIAYMLRISKPIMVVADEDNVQTIKQACAQAEISPKHVVLDKVTENGDISSLELIKETGQEQLFYPAYLGNSEELIAAVVCSSGTTGMPKGISISHANFISQYVFLSNISHIKDSFNFSSLYWLSGFSTLMTGVFNNFTRYITTRRFSTEAFFEIIAKYQIASAFAPPAQLAMILQSPNLDKADLTSIRNMQSGGGFVSTKLRKAIERWLPSGKVSVGYGSSEVGFIAAEMFGSTRDGSVGRLAPNVEVKLLDDEDNRVGINERGVLWARYAIKTLGYLNNPTATEQLISPDGWVCTGDIAYFDNDGFLFIVDRKKEIIKYKNYQISPAEIEAVIEEIPEVLHACVVGLVDEEMHVDLPTAVIALRDGSVLDSQCVIDLVAEKLSDYKQLRGGVFFIDQMPMTVSGKLNRYVIRKIAQEMACKLQTK
ncbi:uncharacterized protein LOC128746054 [Sabethes cyaneus]|uniref:uncharacterized protein LOC128746054 n=1 Tax=Sabethes cyaneus TaxID=53552 RepID=UPI00237DC4F8|nr:uncharacterized protein LOC128746054 [Sabethes cyaneus]